MIFRVEDVTAGIRVELGEFTVSAGPKFTCSRWIGDRDYLTAYVRKSIRFVDGGRKTCLDVAAVVVNPLLWRRGLCRAFLSLVEEVSPWDGVYVEMVLNRHLYAHLTSRPGWVRLPNPDHKSFYYETGGSRVSE